MKIKLLLYCSLLFFGNTTIFSQNHSPTEKYAKSLPAVLSTDTDGDGIPDNIDWDDDNDGILDIHECSNPVVSVDFSTSNNQPYTFLAPSADLGFVFDVYNLDNSFNLIINGNNLSNQEIEFSWGSTANVRFADGSVYGSGAIPEVWQIQGTATHPMFQIIISPNGAVTISGSKFSGGPLLPLVLFNGASFNNIIWNTTANNIIKITQTIQGATYMSGKGTGYKLGFCDIDGDGISNQLDLDSDGDGCFDALEGDENVILNHLNTNGAISGVVDSQGVPVLVNSGGVADIGSDQGQGIGSSLNPNISTCPCEQPLITASSHTICYGGNVTLTSSQTTGNTWSTGQTTQSITVTNPGTYTISYTNGICIPVSTSATITAESNPNIQITGNLTLCESTATQLTASSNGTGNTYTWSTGTTGNTISVTTPGTYTITVKTPANCQYTKSVTVTQGTVPVVQNSSLSQCSSSSTAVFDVTSAQPTISTTANVSFDYYTNQTDALAGNTNTIATPTAYSSGNTTLYVRVKSGTCFKIAQLQLNIIPSVTPTITASSPTICYGGSVTLTSSYSTGNTWSTGATTPSITITTPGIYTLTGSNGTCVSTPASVTILSETNPTINISGNLTFCQGSSTTLTASAQGTGNTFTWSNGVNGAVNTVAAPGTYTVTMTTASACQYQKSVTVIMDAAIIVNITPPSQITCTTSQITLNATASIYQPGSIFSWTASNGGVIVSGANTLTPTVSNSGIYTLTITSSIPFGCSSQASVTVIKNTMPPTISISTPKHTICLGESTVLNATGAATYTWTGLTGSGNTQTVSPATTTTYTVTGIGANGCTAQIPTTITIKVVPEIVSTLHDTEICKGGKSILDAGGGPNYTYLWSTGATTRTINVDLAGTYSVMISNGICSKTFTATVNYILTPEILSIVYKDPTLTITVKNNGNLPVEYSIDGGVIWQSSNIFTNVMRNTQYPVKVRNRETSCETSVTYYTFFMSNVITPNSDGKNDVINFSEISKYGNFQGSIIDKYGKVIFKINTKTPIWNGRYLDSPLPSDTYWYRLFWEDRISKNPVEISGWILLKNRD